jgi:flagellar basal body-associated protein FliL
MPVETEKISKNMPKNTSGHKVTEPGDISKDESANLKDKQEKRSKIPCIFKTIYRLFEARKRPIFYGALGLSLLLVSGVIYLKWGDMNSFLKINARNGKFTNPSKILRQITGKKEGQEKPSGKGDLSYDKKNRIFSFKSFVIPCKEQNQTYISMDISFSVYDKEVKHMIIDKSSWIRALIYDILRKEIHINKGLPLLENMKIIIADGIIAALPDIKIDKVYITNFSVV